MESPYIAQVGLELMGSSDPLSLASQAAGSKGMHHHAWPTCLILLDAVHHDIYIKCWILLYYFIYHLILL
jgi:hypothetical protein